MSLTDLHLNQAYSSDADDILGDFYIPALMESIGYDRLAGFFSSTSLAVAARGVHGLIAKGGVLRLIVSPRLSERDVRVIIDSKERPEDYVERIMAADLETLEDRFVRDHVLALGWMIAAGTLEIRVAIAHDEHGNPLRHLRVEESGIFHQKVGVLRDAAGNTISFSGSLNETASAWLGNIEEFKVFRDWQPAEREYVRADESKFQRFWRGDSPRVLVIDVPTAVRQKLVQLAPKDVADLDLARWYAAPRARQIVLFQHQRDAVAEWLANGDRGIFEMATGSGKTFAALGCLDHVHRRGDRVLTVIACPQKHLESQWKREMGRFGCEHDTEITADGTNRLWRRSLADLILDLSMGHRSRPVVLTTHDTLSSKDFAELLTGREKGVKLFLIADEVHGLGATVRARGLLDAYDMRLGLSATPRRWFDPVGTKALYEYFDRVVYEFELSDAINTVNPRTGMTFLVPYTYCPLFASLEGDEVQEYVEKTERIVRQVNAAKDDEERSTYLDLLRFQRANIVKNARQKPAVLQRLLDTKLSSAKWTIVYCSPQQIDTVMRIVNDRWIPVHRFTEKEGTVPESRYGGLSERDYLLKTFAEGKHRILVAMKCLDEGVDVPPARTAVLMASSGNPREHIQRIGRVLRRHPGKRDATVFDVVVVPTAKDLPPGLREYERRIFSREMDRCEDIAGAAMNNAEALDHLYAARSRLEV